MKLAEATEYGEQAASHLESVEADVKRGILGPEKLNIWVRQRDEYIRYIMSDDNEMQFLKEPRNPYEADEGTRMSTLYSYHPRK